jgi:hypothetical protein
MLGKELILVLAQSEEGGVMGSSKQLTTNHQQPTNDN